MPKVFYLCASPTTHFSADVIWTHPSGILPAADGAPV